MYRHFFKRVFDIVFSLVALIILAIPMLIIAIVVKCTSKGPAIFKVDRVGRKGKPFKFYKFRSMKVDAPKDCAPRYLHSEEYITKVGAFLRKTSLDELPQLWCILKGDMSFIGPRPCGFSEEDLIEERMQRGAYNVRPGLTGLAQVNGRDILASKVDKKAELDGKYAQKITFFGDLKILLKTVKVVLCEEGVVEGTAVIEDEEMEKAENTQAVETLEEVAVANAKDEQEQVS